MWVWTQSRTDEHMTLEKLRSARAGARLSLKSLKIFPLYDAILLPGGVMPLHIFEPRYRQMVADCLAGDRLLAIATLVNRSDTGPRPEVRRTAGVGQIVFDQSLEDGRSIIMLQGLLRAEIVEELNLGTPYRVVQARALDEPPAIDDSGHMATLRHLLDLLAQRLSAESGTADLVRLVANESDPGLVADVVGSAMFQQRETRLRLMEQQCPLERLQFVNNLLADALSRLPACPGGSGLPC
jgi:Lon protease-like protein